MSVTNSQQQCTTRGFNEEEFSNCYIRVLNDQQNEASVYLCMDAHGEKVQEGRHVIGYSCSGRWNQQFHFHPVNQTIYLQVPRIINEIRSQNNETTQYCLGKDHEDYVHFISCALPTNNHDSERNSRLLQFVLSAL